MSLKLFTIEGPSVVDIAIGLGYSSSLDNHDGAGIDRNDEKVQQIAMERIRNFLKEQALLQNQQHLLQSEKEFTLKMKQKAKELSQQPIIHLVLPNAEIEISSQVFAEGRGITNNPYFSCVVCPSQDKFVVTAVKTWSCWFNCMRPQLKIGDLKMQYDLSGNKVLDPSEYLYNNGSPDYRVANRAFHYALKGIDYKALGFNHVVDGIHMSDAEFANFHIFQDWQKRMEDLDKEERQRQRDSDKFERSQEIKYAYDR